MKSISNAATTENTECLIVYASDSFIDLKVGVLLDHYTLILLALQICWATFQNMCKKCPASSTLTLVLHQNHSVHTTNHHLHSSEEVMEFKGDSFFFLFFTCFTVNQH